MIFQPLFVRKSAPLNEVRQSISKDIGQQVKRPLGGAIDVVADKVCFCFLSPIVVAAAAAASAVVCLDFVLTFMLYMLIDVSNSNSNLLLPFANCELRIPLCDCVDCPAARCCCCLIWKLHWPPQAVFCHFSNSFSCANFSFDLVFLYLFLAFFLDPRTMIFSQLELQL